MYSTSRRLRKLWIISYVYFVVVLDCFQFERIIYLPEIGIPLIHMLGAIISGSQVYLVKSNIQHMFDGFVSLYYSRFCLVSAESISRSRFLLFAIRIIWTFSNETNQLCQLGQRSCGGNWIYFYRNCAMYINLCWW